MTATKSLVNARVEAAPNFLSNLEVARLFFIEQDADSASERFRKLKGASKNSEFAQMQGAEKI